MRVCIGITSKNRVEILPKAIESALSQNYSNKQVFVFDDFSKDGTINLKDKYPHVEWIFAEKEMGYVYGRNLMMNLEGFDFFVSLDDDSWFLDNNSLKIALDYMIKNQDVGALAFDILSPTNNIIKTNEVYFSETNTFIGCGHLIRLKALQLTGFYIQNPGYYGGEEKDLSIRLIDEGFRVVKANRCYVYHEKTAISRNFEAQHQSGVCNDLIFCLRRTPIILLIPILCYKILSHLKFALVYKNQSLFKAFIRGIIDFKQYSFKGKLNRKPVKISTLKKFITLSK